MCASVMHESIGTPSTWTVQAPQWPSKHAIFVPVSPRSWRRTSASERSAAMPSSSYVPPFTCKVSSGMRGDREDVGEMDEPGDEARAPDLLGLLVLGERDEPEVVCGRQQLADLLGRLLVAVRG